jgi:dihydroflavonol-4-reductase
MHVFILGGTGFLGYHASLALTVRGHSIRTLALPPLPAEGLFPPEVDIHLGDFNALSDVDILDLMAGCDAVIFAAGADDRVTPKKPAYPFFHRHNVETAERFFRLAKEKDIKRGVLLSSYFAHFDRLWPEMKLAQTHPYIRSRKAQEAAVLSLSGEAMQMVILELPYIFGSMPGRMPLWKPLVDYVRMPLPWLFFPRGGTAMVAVEKVAEAMVGAVERELPSAPYQIGDENLTWPVFLKRLSGAVGIQKKVVTLPDWMVRLGLWGIGLRHSLQGREGGLEPVSFLKLQTAETFFDPTPAQAALGFEGGGLDAAFEATVWACGVDQ